jgi:TolB-like protein/DNA-binding winged helix-turn-helix (wHTH) protein/Tfp pilus assembly protein PilF
MSSAGAAPRIVRFGLYEADLAAGELRKNGVKIKLQERPFQILTMLLEAPGQLVTRETFEKRLWPADTFVDFDHSLNTSIKKLRDALCDDAENPRFIATVGRRGYRLIAPVDESGAAKPEPAPAVVESEAVTGASANLAPARWTRHPRILKIGLLLAAVVLVIAAVGVSADWWRKLLRGRTDSLAIHSIAVLPLENLSHDPAQDYFTDGMTDELITQLAAINSLRVISRRSVMGYRGAKKNLAEIAGELHVDGIVEGSVMRSGDRVRINAQLIHVPTNRNLWAKSYEGDLREVMVLQSEVAQAVAREIEIKLTPQENARLSGTRSVNPEAYEAYLKGRYHADKGTEKELREALGCFNLALRADPGYAPALVGLSNSYYYLSNMYLPPTEAMPQAKAAAERALKLDEKSAGAHDALGLVYLYYDVNLPAAERELRQAVAINPNDAAAHLWYGTYCALLHRREESLNHLTLAQQLDPISVETGIYVGFGFYLLREYDRLIAQSRDLLRMDPGNWGAHANLGNAYRQTGQLREAVAELEKATQIAGSPALMGELGCTYALAGKRREAEKVLADLKQMHQFVPAFAIAIVYVGLGEKRQALSWLEKALSDKSEDIITLTADPQFDVLRNDPSFQSLLRRIGLPQ